MKLKFNFILLILIFCILQKAIPMPMGPMQTIPVMQQEQNFNEPPPPPEPIAQPMAPIPIPQQIMPPPESMPLPLPVTQYPATIQPQPVMPFPQPVPPPTQIIPPPPKPMPAQPQSIQPIQQIDSPYIPVGIPPQQDLIIEQEKSIESQIETTDGEESEDKENIELNFENAELQNFVHYMEKLKKINLIPDPAMAGIKISLVVREPLTVEGAWNIFLTILEMSGFSIIKEPNVYKIVPKDKKLTEPLPTFINVPEDTLPNNDTNIRYLKFLQNIGVNEIRDLLAGMLSSPNSVVAQPEVNGLIITDKSLNIKSAMKVINELDQTGLQESVSILHLKRANASDVKTLFDNLIKKPEGSPLARLLGKQSEGTIEYFSPTTRIITEDRTNSLILLGNQKSIKKIEDFIINNIDTELKGAESPLHVYELQYTDAAQVKEILQEITAPPESVAGQQASRYGAVRGGVKYFRPMSFQVDKDGNRLIVSSVDKQDWQTLKRAIKDLDKPQPQVAVETMFVDIDIDDNKELGGGFHNKKTGMLGKGVDFRGVTFGPAGVSASNDDLLSNLINAANKTVGATILSFGTIDHIWAFLEAIKTQKNTSIITQPFITIANNTQASIESGNRRRNISEESGTTKGYTTITANTKVTLKPQINLDGIIKFDVDIDISEFADSSGGDTKTKHVSTNATVANGQVLVLGGFVKTQVVEQRQKTPILGDIPILGWFAKYKKRQTIKQYTFIFIAPTLIKPKSNPGVDLYTKMKLHSATRDIDEAVITGKTSDPIHNHFFNPLGEDYSHKVVDFANARYQPTTVDIKNDPYYRAQTFRQAEKIEKEVTIKEEQSLEQTKLLENDIESQKAKLKELISTSKLPSKEKLVALNAKVTKKENIQTKIPVKDKQLDIGQVNIDEETKDKLKKLLSVNKINKDVIENNLNKMLAQKEIAEKQDLKARRYRRKRK